MIFAVVVAEGELSCDCPKHKRSLIAPMGSGSCCCSNFYGCHWGTCKNCYTEVIYDLKAPFQLYNLQVPVLAIFAFFLYSH